MSKISARVLKRIAEAADGLRGHGPHWVSVSRSDFRDIRVYPQDLQPPTDPDREMLAVDSVEPSPRPANGPRVTSVVVTYEAVDGSTESRTYYAEPPNGRTTDPAWIDALFLSPSAVEKFVVPYLASVYDPDTGNDVRKGFVQAWMDGRAVALTHVPPTKFINASWLGELKTLAGPLDEAHAEWFDDAPAGLIPDIYSLTE